MGAGEALAGAVTRRDLLRAGMAATALASVPALTRSRPAFAAPARRAFASAAQLRDAQAALDDIGLRATASPAHLRYADGLADRLQRAGVRGVTTEGVPLRRWTPRSSGLDVAGRPVPISSYVPYSGQTPPAGIEAPLRLPGLASGGIAVFDVADVALAHAAFDSGDYGSPSHPDGYDPAAPYIRPWVSALAVPTVLENLRDWGAVGAIGIIDAPAALAAGSYFPYDGVLRGIPSVYVDRDTGAQLRQQAAAGAPARLTLDAVVDDASSPNVYGFIPGRSDELVILQSHHDGTNGLEDNGPEAIVAMCRYLASLDLPRTVLVLLTTGHFSGRAAGGEAFITRHKDDLMRRVVSAVTIEHLGAREWLVDANGTFAATGQPEDGGFFASPYDAVIDPARASLQAAGFIPDRVMRPFLPDQRAPDWVAWPGDGQPWWTMAGLPSANFITGPTYLLSGGISTVDKTDFTAMRRQAMAFTDLIVKLAAAPKDALWTPRAECSTCREPGS